MTSTKLRAEFFLDGDANKWHYRVPALRVNGGGSATREDAERDGLDAIAFALQGDPADFDASAVAVTLDVSVSRNAA